MFNLSFLPNMWFFLSTLAWSSCCLCVSAFFFQKFIWLNSIYSSESILLLALCAIFYIGSMCFMLRDMHFFRVCLLIRLIDRMEKKKTQQIFLFHILLCFWYWTKRKRKYLFETIINKMEKSHLIIWGIKLCSECFCFFPSSPSRSGFNSSPYSVRSGICFFFCG